jgi:hypothetical protein
MRGLVWLGSSVLLVFCTQPAPKEPEYRGQSYREALRVMCKVDELAGLARTVDPLEKSQAREDWLNERIENPDAIYFRTLLKVKSAEEKSAELHAEAKKAGLDTCPLADTIAADPF